jgi:hypothetical protein
MPFTDKQIDLFKAAAADKEFADKVGINQTTAKKLLKESKVKKYEEGGKVDKRTKTIKTSSGRDFTYETSDEIEAADEATRKAQERYFKDEEPKRTRSVKPAPKSGNPASVLKKKCGGKVHKMAKGGTVKKCADGCAIKGKTKGRMV